MSFLLASFYTNNWKYPQYAKNLKEDCLRLKINHHIIEKPSLGTYVGNCNIKPFFILETLKEFKKPILWYDIDGSINQIPQELIDKNILDYDLAVHKNIKFLDKIYVNSIWFNYNPIVLEFVEEWCRCTINFIDDGAFNSTIKKFQDKIKILIMDQSSHLMANTNDGAFSDNVCFVHRLSSSDLKWQYKNKI